MISAPAFQTQLKTSAQVCLLPLEVLGRWHDAEGRVFATPSLPSSPPAGAADMEMARLFRTTFIIV